MVAGVRASREWIGLRKVPSTRMFSLTHKTENSVFDAIRRNWKLFLGGYHQPSTKTSNCWWQRKQCWKLQPRGCVRVSQLASRVRNSAHQCYESFTGLYLKVCDLTSLVATSIVNFNMPMLVSSFLNKIFYLLNISIMNLTILLRVGQFKNTSVITDL